MHTVNKGEETQEQEEANINKHNEKWGKTCKKCQKQDLTTEQQAQYSFASQNIHQSVPITSKK